MTKIELINALLALTDMPPDTEVRWSEYGEDWAPVDDVRVRPRYADPDNPVIWLGS